MTTRWGAITWDDLDDWAGSRSVSRGQSYQRQGRVQKLALAEDGRLLAIVQGTKRYITSAWLSSDKKHDAKLHSACTCPVGVNCKHAVAIVIDLLDMLAEGKQILAADPNDDRWEKLSNEDHDFGQDDELADDEWNELQAQDEKSDDVDKAARHSSPISQRSRVKTSAISKRRTRAQWDAQIQAHLQQKNRAELVELVSSLLGRFPKLRQELQERVALSEGDIDRLMSDARRELQTVTAEIGWQNHWGQEGHTPDYSRLKHRLERLTELGHADEAVGLGHELISRGMEQIGQSQDEGETASALADCLQAVFDALSKSSLSAADKILYAIDACLQDEYDVVGEAAGKILDATWSPADWSLVADRLIQRLGKAKRGTGDRSDFMQAYRRDCLSGFLAQALQHANRGTELLAVYEAEARGTNSYQRLVAYLLDQKQYEAAERWAREGIEQTHQKWPGIAAGLAKSLCDLAHRRKQWNIVAAHAAWEFFGEPSPEKFQNLLAVTEKAGCQPAVRKAAQEFLETGTLPIRPSVGTKIPHKHKLDLTWPLPTPDYLIPLLANVRSQSSSQPHYDVLLEMALREKRLDEVLHWYDKITSHRKNASPSRLQWVRYFDDFDGDRIAKAIAPAYPERALEIFRRKLDAYLPQTGTNAYETCAACLRQMRSIYQAQDREDYWNELLADIREKYHNRPRFMEILDKLVGRTILQMRRKRRR